MLVMPWMMIAGASFVAAAGPSGRWIGQDGRDVVGPSSEVKPSDVQDIHIVVEGLPPAREVVHAIVTGHGGDAWQYRGKSGDFAAVVERAPRSRRADLYLEPTRVETGREFTVKLRYDDGASAEFYVRGGRARPDLRMPAAALVVAWDGQEASDWTGAGPGVGPDGLQDVRLSLGRLSPGVAVRAILIEAPGHDRWCYGLNPEGYSNAELVTDPQDPSKASLYFQPAADLDGRRLRLKVSYANGNGDVATVRAGPTDPSRPMPEIRLPRPIEHAIEADWLGQDEHANARPGDVHVAIAGVPGGLPIAAALSDAVRGYWAYRSDPGDRASIEAVAGESPLVLRRGDDSGRVDLFFAPVRDESGRTMALRLILSNGATAVVRFPGGSCDLNLRVPEVAGTTVAAKPGDDLDALVNRHRTVKLARGTYRLTRPLVLNRTVALIGEPGATLLFDQGGDEPSWAAAILIHRGRTTLDGFAIRFAGPIRWKADVPWGPAVIGVTEIVDNSHPDPRIGLTLTNLDLEAPPAADPSGWAEAPRLMRLVNATSGRVANNRLKGGPVELCDGPWEVVGNVSTGTMPGTASPNVIAAHNHHDLLVRGNRAGSVGPSGKTWRFLVMTGSGYNDRIEENVVVGIGPRDDDTIPPANMPEVILTEAYHLHFEGKPAAISPDGLIVGLGRGRPLGPPAHAGSLVAVVTGSRTGLWRRVAQVIDRTTFLLDEPLPTGTDRIAIATGFVGATFARNTIDSRGGAKASNLVLAGNHFGTSVRDNHLLGGGDAFQVTAFPSESPCLWGWSHAPFLGALIEGNTIEDAERGATLGVIHSEYTKSSRGRTYMTATLRDNTVRWTAEFLRRHAPSKAQVPPTALTIGYRRALDPDELIVRAEDNHIDAPAGTPPSVTLRVHAAILNGRRTLDQGYALPTLPSAASSDRSKGDRR